MLDEMWDTDPLRRPSAAEVWLGIRVCACVCVCVCVCPAKLLDKMWDTGPQCRPSAAEVCREHDKERVTMGSPPAMVWDTDPHTSLQQLRCVVWITERVTHA